MPVTRWPAKCGLSELSLLIGTIKYSPVSLVHSINTAKGRLPRPALRPAPSNVPRRAQRSKLNKARLQWRLSPAAVLTSLSVAMPPHRPGRAPRLPAEGPWHRWLADGCRRRAAGEDLGVLRGNAPGGVGLQAAVSVIPFSSQEWSRRVPHTQSCSSESESDGSPAAAEPGPWSGWRQSPPPAPCACRPHRRRRSRRRRLPPEARTLQKLAAWQRIRQQRSQTAQKRSRAGAIGRISNQGITGAIVAVLGDAAEVVLDDRRRLGASGDIDHRGPDLRRPEAQVHPHPVLITAPFKFTTASPGSSGTMTRRPPASSSLRTLCCSALDSASNRRSLRRPPMREM